MATGEGRREQSKRLAKMRDVDSAARRLFFTSPRLRERSTAKRSGEGALPYARSKESANGAGALATRTLD
jgi:hypothetical protein